MSKRLTDQEKKDMKELTYNLLGKRIQMAKFPMTQEELYGFWQGLMPVGVVEAIHTINTNEVVSGMLNTSNRIAFNAFEYRLDIYGDGLLWKTPRGGINIRSDHEKYKELHDFMALRHRVEAETKLTNNVVRSLVSHATAAGQIKRVWPELASFLSSEAASSLRDVTRASRIPPHFNIENFNARKDMLNRVLAEAHILPELVREKLSFSVSLNSP